MREALNVRFWSKVARNDADGCWLWSAGRDPKGYGQFQHDGRSRRAHRVAYELAVGPIPDGLVLDHLCSNPPCVNPAHLEPVTQRENLLRSSRTITGILAAKTHCKHGHPFDKENTYHDPNGRRRCLICCRRKSREWKARRRARAQEANNAAR